MNAIEVSSLGKMYRLYDNNFHRALDALNIGFLKAKNYKEFWALRDVDLIVPKGERLAIIGRNGAGKSTLLKILCGNVFPTEGTLSINGEIQAMLQMGTGFNPDFTGLENVYNAMAYNGIMGKEAEEYAESIVDFSEIGDYIHQPVKFFSAGMYSRLAFSVSTALKPDILIIDEVLGAGDAYFVAKCAERMKQITRDSGATVLFVSHSMDSVIEICDRAILLEKGSITEKGTSLMVSKVYNAKVRKEEELRNRTRELQKGNTLLECSQEDVYQRMLFRLNYGERTYAGGCRLYAARLMENSTGDKQADLNVGSPSDNSLEQLNRIVHQNDISAWSESKKDSRGYHRGFVSQEDTDYQACFELAIPQHATAAQYTLEMDVEYEAEDENEYLDVDVFDGQEYWPLGKLHPGDQTFSALLPAFSRPLQKPDDGIETPAASTTSNVEEKRGISFYGTNEVEISKIDLHDSCSSSKRVFSLGETICFEVDFSVKTPISYFSVAATLMTRTGRVVSQVFLDSTDLQPQFPPGNYHLQAQFSPMRFGIGEYMASLGFFKSCDYSKVCEEEAYCVCDRAIFFSVSPAVVLRKELGSFLTPCLWRFNEHTVAFDGVQLAHTLEKVTIKAECNDE